jgi:hypothetical protein
VSLLALAVALCAPAIPLLGQTVPTQTTQPAADQSPDWTAHYRDSTISFGRIVVEGDHKRFQVIGTGVMVAIAEHKGYIVTAKHVFDDPAQGWHPSELRIRFAWQEKYSVEELLGKPITLIDSKGTNLWSALSDESDLAAIEVPKTITVPLDGLGLSDFATHDDVFDGGTVFIYGFPGIIGNERLVRAVTRSGVIAWTDPSGPLDHPFLVDANILPGNSGGPVFKVPIGLARAGGLFFGPVKFLGIVTTDISQFYKVTADGRMVQVKWPDLPLPSNAVVQVTGIGGLGSVEPASKVRHLIEQLEHK